MELGKIKTETDFEKLYGYVLLDPAIYYEKRKVIFPTERDAYDFDFQRVVKCNCPQKILNRSKNIIIFCCEQAVHQIKKQRLPYRLITYKNLWDYNQLIHPKSNFAQNILKEKKIISFTDIKITTFHFELNTVLLLPQLEYQTFIHPNNVELLFTQLENYLDKLEHQLILNNFTLFHQDTEVFDQIGVSFKLLNQQNQFLGKFLHFEAQIINDQENLVLELIKQFQFQQLYQRPGIYVSNIVKPDYNEDQINSLVSAIWEFLNKYTQVQLAELLYLPVNQCIFNILDQDINIIKSIYYNTIFFEVDSPSAGNILKDSIINNVKIQVVVIT